MENIQDLPQPVRECIEMLKEKATQVLLSEEELAFLMARRDYLTEEEKEKLFPKEEVVVEVKKRGRKPTKTA